MQAGGVQEPSGIFSQVAGIGTAENVFWNTGTGRKAANELGRAAIVRRWRRNVLRHGWLGGLAASPGVTTIGAASSTAGSALAGSTGRGCSLSHSAAAGAGVGMAGLGLRIGSASSRGGGT